MEINKNEPNNILPLKNKRLRCPTCKKPALITYSPFCSKKCADLDLGKWLIDGKYTEVVDD